MKFTITDFNPLEIQLFATCLVVLWFEVLHLGLRIKKALYTNTHFWIGSIFVLFFIFTKQLENGLIYLALNFLTSYTYDKLQAPSNG
jgi:hypothetical protein